jgi:hypothetical protein
MSQWIHRLMLSSLVGVLGFFAVNTYTRLTAIECGLNEMKVELARMRLIGEEEVRRICRYEIMAYVHDTKVNSDGKPPILK